MYCLYRRYAISPVSFMIPCTYREYIIQLIYLTWSVYAFFEDAIETVSADGKREWLLMRKEGNGRDSTIQVFDDTGITYCIDAQSTTCVALPSRLTKPCL